MKLQEATTFRQLRRQRGFDSDRKVATQAGISPASLCLALAGKTVLGRKGLAKLAAALNVPEEELLLLIRSEAEQGQHRKAQ